MVPWVVLSTGPQKVRLTVGKFVRLVQREIRRDRKYGFFFFWKRIWNGRRFGVYCSDRSAAATRTNIMYNPRR